MNVAECKQQALWYAQLIIEVIEKKNPDIEFAAYISSGCAKYLEIRTKQPCDLVQTFQGPTYYDLFRTVQSAWQTYLAINRKY